MIDRIALHVSGACLLAVVLCAANAQANHHTFDVGELFSNADGTIQFVELFEANGTNGQNVFGGRAIDANSGAVVFPSNLPSSTTANKRVLIGTAGFAATPGAPAPDYVLPDNFLSVGPDQVRFCSSGTCTTVWDTLAYATLPTDGVTSLVVGGSTGVNSPTNFSGQSGSIDVSEPASEVPSFQPSTVVVLIAGLLGVALTSLYGLNRAERNRAEPA